MPLTVNVPAVAPLPPPPLSVPPECTVAVPLMFTKEAAVWLKAPSIVSGPARLKTAPVPLTTAVELNAVVPFAFRVPLTVRLPFTVRLDDVVVVPPTVGVRVAGTVKAMSIAVVPLAVSEPTMEYVAPLFRFSAPPMVKRLVFDNDPPDWTVRPPVSVVVELMPNDAPLTIVSEP